MNNQQVKSQTKDHPDWEIHPVRKNLFFVEAYSLKAEANNHWWATIYTYGDGEWMYKFGKRIDPTNVDKNATFTVHHCDAYYTHKKLKGEYYNTRLKAQKACLSHIARVVAKEKIASKGKTNANGKQEGMSWYDEQECYDKMECESRMYPHSRKNGMLFSKPKPLSIREELDNAAADCMDYERYQSAPYPEKIIPLQFGKTDKYGQRHASVRGVELSMEGSHSDKLEYIWLKINGVRQRFHLLYSDAGTMGYSRMYNRWAIGGELTNVSTKYWGTGKRKRGEIMLAWIIGSVDNNVFSGQIWYNSDMKKLRAYRASEKRKAEEEAKTEAAAKAKEKRKRAKTTNTTKAAA